MNWPYLLQVSATAPAVKGKVGFMPFPSATGTPAAALGGDDVVVNAKSAHQAAAWKFIPFMTSNQQQISRAIKTGDAPAAQAAYTTDLYSQAPYFRQVLPLLKVTANRPVTPDWLADSQKLQTPALFRDEQTGQPIVGTGQRLLTARADRQKRAHGATFRTGHHHRKNPQHAPTPAPGMESQQRRFGRAMVLPAVLTLIAITGYPLFYNVWNSSHNVNYLAPPMGSFAGISNYKTIFTNNSFIPSLVRRWRSLPFQ